MSRLNQVKKYLDLLAKFEVNESQYKEILHPEFEQREFPNALNKSGQKSTYSEVFKRMNIGKSILSHQSYTIDSFLESPERMYVEAKWNGTMTIDAGPLKKGQSLVAHFCMAFEFKDDLIYRQRNYDCFEPFS